MFVLNECRTFIYLIKSQSYNEFFDCSYLIDVLLWPAFRFVDCCLALIGPFFIFAVLFLTLLVVLFAYRVGIPYYWSISPTYCAVLVVAGHWILINVVFNYFMAVRTNPGYPSAKYDLNQYSICKKCFISKPQRTHHCSVCNRCILKMDHHCPWINNCVGFYNHRYFYLYMTYLLIGVMFLTVFGFNLAIDMIFNDGDADDIIQGYPVNENDVKEEPDVLDVFIEDVMYHTLPYLRKLVVYVSLIVLGVLISISYFVYYHGRLISGGQTAIEELINNKERERCRKLNQLFVNPYDFGFRDNWRICLGLRRNQSFVKHVLMPCKFVPLGDGVNWTTIYDCHKKDRLV